MEQVTIETKVQDFIKGKFIFNKANNFNQKTSLFEEGIIDSTGVLELILFLEESFSVEIKDEEIVPENLNSVSNIARFMKTKL